MNNLRIICVVLLAESFALSQEVITDTIYSNNALDGGICYMYEENRYYISPGTPDGSGAGDGYNPFLWVWVYCRSYYSFDLMDIPIDITGFELIDATFQLFQLLSWGNDEDGVYPVWDFPGGDTNYCYLDHVDYGNVLDVGDWTAGDEGDPQTLTPLYTIVSTTPDTGFRNMKVTPLVESDIVEGRNRSQFRIHFPIGTDYDRYADMLGFSKGSPPFTYRKPKLIVQYRIGTTGVEDENSRLPDNFLLMQNYPNPFNSSTTISYEINSPGVYEVTIFDINGKKSIVLKHGHHTIGKYKVLWDGKNSEGVNMPSGIYFYGLSSKYRYIKRKLLLIR